MAEDIIDQLNDLANSLDRSSGKSTVWGAAAEIIRLRKERDDWQAAYRQAFDELGHVVDKLQQLLTAGDAMAQALDDISEGRTWISDLVSEWQVNRD